MTEESHDLLPLCVHSCLLQTWTDEEVVWSWSWQPKTKKKRVKVYYNNHQQIRTGYSPCWSCSTRSASIRPYYSYWSPRTAWEWHYYTLRISWQNEWSSGNDNRYHVISVIWILQTEDGRKNGTCKMFDMIFFVWKSQWMRCIYEWNTTHCMLVYQDRT